MKTTHVVRTALKALKDGDRLFQQGNSEGSVQKYNKALSLSKSLPAEVEFDHPILKPLAMQVYLPPMVGWVSIWRVLQRQTKHFASMSRLVNSILSKLGDG